MHDKDAKHSILFTHLCIRSAERVLHHALSYGKPLWVQDEDTLFGESLMFASRIPVLEMKTPNVYGTGTQGEVFQRCFRVSEPERIVSLVVFVSRWRSLCYPTFFPTSIISGMSRCKEKAFTRC